MTCSRWAVERGQRFTVPLHGGRVRVLLGVPRFRLLGNPGLGVANESVEVREHMPFDERGRDGRCVAQPGPLTAVGAHVDAAHGLLAGVERGAARRQNATPRTK
jgi:hypothetical protein